MLFLFLFEHLPVQPVKDRQVWIYRDRIIVWDLVFVQFLMIERGCNEMSNWKKQLYAGIAFLLVWSAIGNSGLLSHFSATMEKILAVFFHLLIAGSFWSSMIAKRKEILSHGNKQSHSRLLLILQILIILLPIMVGNTILKIIAA